MRVRELTLYMAYARSLPAQPHLCLVLAEEVAFAPESKQGAVFEPVQHLRRSRHSWHVHVLQSFFDYEMRQSSPIQNSREQKAR